MICQLKGIAMRVLPEVAERCLNHTEENKVKRINQRHSYENEMQQAWARSSSVSGAEASVFLT